MDDPGLAHCRRGMRRRAAAALLALAAASAAAAADFAVLVQDQPAGHLKVTADAGARLISTDYSYRDNGRGPDIRETIRLDERGQPIAYEASGTLTFGATLNERFALRDGRAQWTSHADAGDEPAGDDFVFAPLEATAAYADRLVRFALARGGSVTTISGVRLGVEVVARWTPAPAAVAAGGAAPPDRAGTPGPLALVAVTGLSEVPQLHWIRDDGSHAFFAFGWPGFAIVEKGFEALAPELVKRTTQAGDERFGMLRRRLALPLEGLTLVRAVRWFDAPAARMRGPSDVWLYDGRIAAVTAPGALPGARPEQVIDGAGRTLLPGLWDMHGHIWTGSCLMHLAGGVTGVRDPASQNDHMQRLRGQQQRGEIACPLLVPLGFIEGRSPHSARLGFVVPTLDEGLAAVDWYAARGYRGIKLYNSIRPEWVAPLARHAHRLGLTVAGHIPAFMRAEQAVRAGYDEITHINQVMLNFVARPGDDTRTLLRFERVGEDGARLDLKSPQARAFVALLRERGTTVDATVATFESMFTQAQGQPSPTLAAVAAHLPVMWQRGLRSAEMDLRGARLATFRTSYRRMLELTAAMHRAGIPIVAGTDGVAGLGLHREAELYVQAGIPAPEALRILTWNGARIAGEGARRGRIERGYAADLVLVDGNPAERIGDLRRASLVIQGHVAYSPAALYEAMGFKPFVPAARIEKTAAP